MMLEDAQPKLLITTQAQLARFHDIPGMEYLCYSQPLPVSDATPLRLSLPHHTAYIIFTSGSTGQAERGDGGTNGDSQPAAVDAGSLSVDGG
ncbi:enterobactin synthetase component F [Salmonella enterica subsp. enterica serovar Typhimurium]|nr:enterobactin synthetase component F [Salmonella enterica subsp. enterica serovar Typhimurium]